MNDHIAVDVREGVQTIRFDRAEQSNALTAEMFDMAADAVSLAERNTSVRAVVLAGMPGVFTAGHDADDLRSYVEQVKFGDAPIRFMKTFATIDKPVVAAVDGVCVGIGTVLLLHCDFVVASEWSLFSSPCADMGVPPEGGASLLAPAILGYHRAFELLVLGEQFDTQRGLMSGLINRVVPAEEVDGAAFGYARALAAKPPEAVRMARRLMRGDRRDVLTRINQEAASFVDLLRSPAAMDALIMFIDRKRR
ncbi:MAG TPA: enoyl-CoA hydratase-related protein [Bauldia sp.]|nr:enoyl-CoA hydratase-related protein [Bauldia sp.]